MNKYLALKGEDKFDINKITVVGSPTITSDGVASGFSSGNYVSTNIDLSNKTFIIESPEFTYLEDTTQAQYVFNYGSWANGMYVVANLYEDGTINCAITNSSTPVIRDYSIKAIKGNKYQVKFVLDDEKAEIYLKANGMEYVLLQSVANSQLYTVKTTTMFIGTEHATSSRVCKGSIDLPSSKIYVDNQLVFQPVKPTYLLEQRKTTIWDKEQFTIVGNPSVSEDGFISNCSGSNYAKINNPITSVNNKFQVDCTIPIGTGVPFVIYIGTAARMYFWRNANNKLLVVLRSKSTDLLNTTVTVPETSLNVKCIVENNTCLVNVNGETLINKTITASAFFEMLNNSDYFTFGSDIANNPFNQPLNLKTFKIYTDNTLVFDGGKERYLYDSSKFTVVGSPTIIEDGIASGFGRSNFLKLPKILPTCNTFHIKCKFMITELAASGISTQILFTESLNSSFLANGINIGIAMNTMNVYTQVGDGTNRNTVNQGIAINLNTWYWLEFIDNGAQYIQRLSTDGINYSEQSISKTVNRSASVEQSTIGIYHYPSGYNDPLLGNFDLKELSIVMDGKEVFTGAKENFYILRR